jgi:hypothetical protein
MHLTTQVRSSGGFSNRQISSISCRSARISACRSRASHRYRPTKAIICGASTISSKPKSSSRTGAPSPPALGEEGQSLTPLLERGNAGLLTISRTRKSRSGHLRHQTRRPGVRRAFFTELGSSDPAIEGQSSNRSLNDDLPSLTTQISAVRWAFRFASHCATPLVGSSGSKRTMANAPTPSAEHPIWISDIRGSASSRSTTAASHGLSRTFAAGLRLKGDGVPDCSKQDAKPFETANTGAAKRDQ